MKGGYGHRCCTRSVAGASQEKIYRRVRTHTSRALPHQSNRSSPQQRRGASSGSHLRLPPGEEHVYGLQAVEAVLTRAGAGGEPLAFADINTEDGFEGRSTTATTASPSRRLHRLYLLHEAGPGRKGRGDEASRREVSGKRLDALTGVRAIAQTIGVPIEQVSRDALSRLVGPGNLHQGVALHCSVLRPQLANYLETVGTKDKSHGAGVSPPLWVALDEVWDPHNFGAIVRSSLFFGVNGIVLSEKNCCPPSSHVSKASAGALEFMRLYRARYLTQFLSESSRRGWNIIGAALDDRSQTSSRIALRSPSILVLGNEGYGLRSSVLQACTETVRIEGSPQRHTLDGIYKLDSLNVSVAAGVLLHQLSQFREK